MFTFHQQNPALDVKEAAILALGTIASVETCQAEMAQFINPMLEFFVTELSSESMLIRSSSLYAVSQFAHWCSANLSDEHYTQYMGMLAARLQETDRHIRETAC